MNSEKRNSLRRDILARRDKMPADELEEKSALITSELLSLPEINAAGVVFVYMHFRSEVQTREIIGQMLAAKKFVAIPLTMPAVSGLEAVRITDPIKQVAPGYCGIPEPLPELVATARCDPKMIEVALVPGSVFDRNGGRLGYGGGYYDRFLSTEATGAVRIGLAFELQMVEQVPVEPHDQLMDYIITEMNIYNCRRHRHASNSSVP